MFVLLKPVARDREVVSDFFFRLSLYVWCLFINLLRKSSFASSFSFHLSRQISLPTAYIPAFWFALMLDHCTKTLLNHPLLLFFWENSFTSYIAQYLLYQSPDAFSVYTSYVSPKYSYRNRCFGLILPLF